jgi:hypothetical protein
MENYQDKWSRWHHKPTDGINPSSNNGWVYTAYASKILPSSIDMNKLFTCYRECTRSLSPIKIDRSPNLSHPPLSKDEVIGLVSLGFLTDYNLKSSSYNFCNLESSFIRKLSLSSFICGLKSLWKIRKEHRNYAWQQNIVETYPLLFKLMPWDIYYVKKYYNKKTSLFQKIMFYLNFISVIMGNNNSTKMMLWLQLEDLNHPLKKIIPYTDYIVSYFGEFHPLSNKIKKKH